MNNALNGIERLKRERRYFVIIPNDKLLQMRDKENIY